MKNNSLETQVGGSHYKNMCIQPIEFIERNDLGFCVGNIIKYVCRYKDKNGIEDLEKARHYIDILIDFEREAMQMRENEQKFHDCMKAIKENQQNKEESIEEPPQTEDKVKTVADIIDPRDYSPQYISPDLSCVTTLR